MRVSPGGGVRVAAYLAALFSLLSGPAIAADSTGSLAGRVVDPLGQPIAGAQLRVEAWRSGRKMVASGTSADDGTFAISRVPVGPRLVAFITAADFGREYRDDIAVFPEQATDLGDIRLAPGCVASGRIVKADGQPASNVKVTIHAWRHQLGHTIESFGPDWHATTDAEGRFKTPPLPVSYIGFEVEPLAGFVAAKVPAIYIGPSEREARVPDITLEPEMLLTGIVTDAFGKPIIGANVYHQGNYKEHKTNALGQFQLDGCTEKMARKVLVYVEADGYGLYSETEPKEPPRQIVLTPCTYLSGQAIDVDSGRPVKLEQVRICEVRRDADGTPHSYGCGEPRFTQEADGRFRISVSTPGEKHLTLMAQGYHTADQYLPDADPTQAAPVITIKMRQSGSQSSVAKQRIRGVVRSGSQPAAGVWVSLWQKRAEFEAINAGIKRGRTIPFTYRPAAIDALTDATGAYLLDVGDPGEYYVVAQPRQGTQAVSAPVELKPGQQQVCDLELVIGGTIVGQVAGVEPDVAQGLYVVAFGRVPYLKLAPVDREGRFVLHDVPPGEIGLKVGHEGYVDSDVTRYPWTAEQAKIMSEPWKRATIVTIRSGETTSGLKLDYPEQCQPDGQWEW